MKRHSVSIEPKPSSEGLGSMKHRSFPETLQHIVLWLITIVVILSTVFSGVVSAKTYNEMTPTEQAVSRSYARIMQECISRTTAWKDGIFNDRITQENAEGYRFFSTSRPIYVDLTDVGTFLKSRSQSVTDNLTIVCGNESGETPWLKEALDLWGWSSPIDFLCDAGATREGGGDCKAATANKFNFLTWSQVESAIKKKAYGNGEIVISPAAEYVYSRDLFFSSQQCMNGQTAPYTGSTRDASFFGDVPIIGNDGSLTPQNFYTPGAPSPRCASFVESMKNTAQSYADWVKEAIANGNTEDIPPVQTPGSGGSTTSKPTCGSIVTGIGWIICPVLDSVAGFNDWSWSLVENLLKVNPLRLENSGDQSNPNQALYNVWQMLLNIANVILVIIFLVVIYGQITGGVSNYNIKRILPKLLIMAVAINFSAVIVTLLVDVFNILGSALYDFLKASSGNIKADIGWGQLIGVIVGGGALVAAGGVALVASGGAAATLLLILPAAAIAALGFLAALLTLVVRQALIPILAVLAPLAFAAAILPNTEQWFKKWWSALIAMLVLYPMAALLFGGVQIAAYIIAADQANNFTTLIALIMMGAPLFMLPFLARQTGPLLGKLNGAMSGMAGKVKPLVAGWSDPRSKLSAAKYDVKPIRLGRNGKPILRDSIRSRRRGYQDTKMANETTLEGARSDATEAYQDRLLYGYDGVNANTINEFALKAAGGDSDKAKIMLDRLSATRKSENLKKSMATLATDFAREKAAGGNTDAFLQERILKATSDSDRDAALHMASQTGRSQVLRNIQNDNAYSASSELRLATQEAISTNVSSLIGKAPDLVKGSGPAFNNITAEQLAGFDESTGKAYMDYLAGMPETHSDPTEQAKLVAAKTRAIQSYINASEGIKKDVKLQNTFNSNTGNAIREALSSNPSTAGHTQLSQLDSYIRSSMDGSGNIR